jgi:hypothetical protein
MPGSWASGSRRPAARAVVLTATDNVFLNRIQSRPKILCSISETSRIEEHRRTDWGLVRILPPVSRNARGQGKSFRISQDPILEEPYLIHDIGYGAEDFKTGFDDPIRIESGKFNRDPLKPSVGNHDAVRAY